MARLFGTDGVRGVAGVDLTADLARSISAASVVELAAGHPRPLVVVGRDPRPSGPWLQDAAVEGLTSAGADVVLLGVIPTPAVARAVDEGLPGLERRPDFGLVISASHNPAGDNGIKLFGPGGVKLDDDTERRIEARLAGPVAAETSGMVIDRSADLDWYVNALVASLPARLDGVSVVVDCANGAASTVAAMAYRNAGAQVSVINTDLGGERINDGCGATHLEALQAAVVAEGADVGIAHDGDADRCLAVSADGSVVDGDQILAVLAVDRHQRGALTGDELVVTVMSNLGLHRAMRAQGISVAVTPVGDRHVAERMRADGAVLGGEQSGHVVLLDHATTGDGILTGLHLLAAVAASSRPLAELAAIMQTMPQVLINVRVPDPAAAMAAAQALVDETAARLGDDGRVLVRPSGTEPLVRVMVEAATDAAARADAERIAAAIEAVR